MTVDVFSVARLAMQYHSAADTLEWDERTGMPPAAGGYRAEQVSLLRTEAHRRRTDAAYGDALADAVGGLADDDDSVDAANLRWMHRDFVRDAKLPTELVAELARITVVGQQVWQSARANNDFAAFAPTLKQIVDLKREVGSRYVEGTDRSVYDGLLDEYEPDARSEEVAEVFAKLRKPLVALITRLADAPRQPPVEVLKRDYGLDGQRRLSRAVASAVGFDFDRGRIDETTHPFCTTLGPDDIRILTRFEPHWLSAGLYGTLHEAGHGMYEQGLPVDHFGLPAGSYVSLGIHESQSRLWENQVGRSAAFSEFMLPTIREIFPSQTSDLTPETLFAAVNAVEPSLIRVEADEATYNLHIIIRFELERQLIDGSLSVDDLPSAWNQRYQNDLGVRVPNDTQGVLQDVHWSAGLIGYFPTYTLGNLASAQLYDAASEAIGDVDAQIRRGEFEPLLDWLRTHVHRHGRTVPGPELVQRATGKPLDDGPLIRHLTEKLESVYGL